MKTAKRVFDVAVSAVLLLILTPLLAMVAAAVIVTMGRPVIFRQERPGLHGRLFVMYKFRTMKNAVGPDGRPLPDCERLTPLGRLLRATSLDELPELFNVIRGDMSLVGPRPLLPQYMPYYTEREQLRHKVRPGITGWAQVCGRNKVSWDERLAADVWYVENWSLWLDLKIVARTLVVVLFRSGVVIDPASKLSDLDVERAGRLIGGAAGD